jgi:myo-inositol 2-dehydrogenase/D-chiro-inositol 1-dehydrogenase
LADLRLGLIGCGRIAERGYVPALGRASGVRLTAVADPVQERCARVAPGVPSFPSAAELVQAGAVDALVLASPVAVHLSDARLAADSGIPTLIEKPPARDPGEAAQLALLSPAPRIAFNRRFDPELAAIRKAVQARIERLDLLFVMRTRKSSWRSHDVDDDVVLDLGPHVVDLALWISGADPTAVSGTSDRRSAAFELQLGDRGVARIECAANRPYLERIVVQAGGESVARYERGGLLQGARAILAGPAAESPLVPSLTRQLESFARAVRGGAEPELASAADGVRVMRVLAVARPHGETA